MTNLIMIDCHDLGRHLACYGWSSVNSDHIDQLAAVGVRFTNSYCTAPQCCPSRAALYTGRYGHANGMLGLAHEPFSWRMHADETYLARYLQATDYHTAHVGVQHVVANNEADVKGLGFDTLLPGFLAPEVAESATAFLHRQSHEKPFFLNIGFIEPHRDSEGGFAFAPPDDAKGVHLPPYIPDTGEARQEFAELQGVIKQMDEAVGQILSALDDAGLRDDTWVIFTTDHGLAMPRAKCTMYDPGIEAALVMHAPSLNIAGGEEIDALVSHVDLVPTILEGFGLPVPDHLHGRSYWARLQGDTFAPREAIYASKTFHTDYEPQRALRTQRYKLIWNAEVDIINVPADVMHSPIYPQMIDILTVERPPFELYDLADNPGETINRADEAAYATILDDLRQQLLAWMQETDDPLLRGPISSPYYDRAMHQLTGNARS